jgi:Predicted HD superfamily hydrolase
MSGIRSELREYVEAEIIPRYRDFDKAHQEDHVRMVIRQALELGERLGADIEMLYTAAAYHDTGLVEGRERHHLVSGSIIRADKQLREWFAEEEIEQIAEAAEDHRASSDHEPRSLYGRIIAEADRFIDADTIVRRTVQYSLTHYPELNHEGHVERCVSHLREKYGDGGYLKLWIPDSPNAQRLEKLRVIIRDESRLREVVESILIEEA